MASKQTHQEMAFTYENERNNNFLEYPFVNYQFDEPQNPLKTKNITRKNKGVMQYWPQSDPNYTTKQNPVGK